MYPLRRYGRIPESPLPQDRSRCISRDHVTMSHNHNRLLQTILEESLGANIHWRDVESLLRHLGAAIAPGHGARMKIELNGVIGTLHRPHHSGVCSKQDIRHIRDFLTEAGVVSPPQ